MDLNEEEFRKWVEKILDSHEDETDGMPALLEKSKQLLVSANDDEEIKSRLACVKEIVSAERLECNSSRNIGEWQKDTKLTKIVNQRGTKILSMGFHNSDEKYLSAFESLYLVESNRLEIFDDGIPWTVCKAYQTLLPTHEDVLKYKAYRKFALIEENTESLDDTSEEHSPQRKKLKTSASSSDNMCEISDSQRFVQDKVARTKTFKDIFEDLKASGPSVLQEITEYSNDKRSRSSDMPLTSEMTAAKFLEGDKSLFCCTTAETPIVVQHIVTPDLFDDGL